MGQSVIRLSDGVTIDQGAIIACPKLGFANRRVAKCSECECFQGLREINENAEVPWHLKYMMICGYPIDRRCDMVIEE